MAVAEVQHVVEKQIVTMWMWWMLMLPQEVK
jgi:hypothetical protein